MSIYPVKITEWYDNPESAFHKERGTLKKVLKYYKCEECGKKIPWKTGYVMHSITHGGPSECWCTKKCLEKERYNG